MFFSISLGKSVENDKQKYMENTQVVMSVKDILENRFAATVSLEVLELDDEGKYMVIEKRDLYQGSGKLATMLQQDVPHNAVHTHTTKDISDDQPAEGREMSNVILCS